MSKEKNNLNVKVTDYGDKSGTKIDIYDKDPKEPDHKSIHIKVNYEDKSFTTVDNVNGDKETSSGNCFLTTACIKNTNGIFDDNCYELSLLRWFRDLFVTNEDICHYYQTAPVIIEAIEKRTDKDDIYNYIYNEMIKECIVFIENNEYNYAYEKYKSGILILEEQFARKEYQKKIIENIKKIYTLKK